MKVLGSVFLFILFQFNSSCNQKAEPETYLIPSNFVGKVNILFSRSDGVAKIYEGNRRVYKIPSNGILVTQFESNYGFLDREYYSIYSNNQRKQLQVFEYDTKDSNKWVIKDPNEKGIFLDGISGQYGNTDDPKSVKYQVFIVSNYSSLDSFFTKKYQTDFDDKLEKITGLTFNLE